MSAAAIGRERGFLLTALVPTFFFLVCFYVYPTLFNLETSLTDLSLFGLRRGGEWVGVENYGEVVRFFEQLIRNGAG